jgi:tetratricopeptide (TPR) repeat protein
MNPIYALTQRQQEVRALAGAQVERGAWEGALRALEELREVSRQLGDRGGEILGWLEAGRVERARGAWEASRSCFASGLGLAGQAEEVEITARLIFEDARTLLDSGEAEAGLGRLRQASELAQQLVGRGPEVQIRTELAMRLLALGRLEEARAEGGWSLKLAMSTRQTEALLQAAFAKLQAEAALGDGEAALGTASEIREVVAQVGGDAQVQLALKLAEVRASQGDRAAALGELEAAEAAVQAGGVSPDLGAWTAGLLRAWGEEARAEAVEGKLSAAEATREEQVELVQRRWSDGEAALASGSLGLAQQAFGEVLAVGRALGEVEVQIDALKALGHVAEREGALGRAVYRLGQAAALAASERALEPLAASIFEVGRLRFVGGDVHGALEALREVERLQVELRDGAGLARTRVVIAGIFNRLGLLPEARRVLDAVEASPGAGVEVEAGVLLQAAFERACLERLEGELTGAEARFAGLVEAARRAGRADLAATCEAQVGDVLRAQGRLEEAARWLERAEGSALALGDQRLVSMIKHWRGLTLQAEGRLEEARAALRDAWALAQASGADPAELARFKDVLDAAVATPLPQAEPSGDDHEPDVDRRAGD